jgi:histidine ammonia-lyase
MDSFHQINHERLRLEDVDRIVSSSIPLALSDEATEAIKACREYLDKRMENESSPIYGINTGFGSLCNTKINAHELGKLQENLVKSHACGMGEEIPQSVVRLMLFLKIQGLSYGHSGVQLVTVQRLIDFYNNAVYPVVYSYGSLGASGDLAPLAHLSLPLIGLGEVNYKGQRISGSEVLEIFGWEAIALKSKEGLALLNGTQFMSAYATHVLNRAYSLFNKLTLISALSLDAYDGRIEPFSDLPHLVRKQPGQMNVAQDMRKAIEGSELIRQEKAHVQDPYSFRCIPQVHGASLDAMNHVRTVVENEINSVTDNPTVFVEEDQIISAGNFHGQPLAINMDYLAIALAELGSISERRIYKLISGDRGLPPFLVANPGLNSGFMIAQYTAASIVSANKQLCTPASVDTIDSSNGQEDHVSMGANAATKLYKVLENVERIAAIELLTGAQALEFRRPNRSSAKIDDLHKKLRAEVPFIEDDIEMHVALNASCKALNSL